MKLRENSMYGFFAFCWGTFSVSRMQFGLKPLTLETYPKMRSAAPALIACLGELGHEENMDKREKDSVET